MAKNKKKSRPIEPVNDLSWSVTIKRTARMTDATYKERATTQRSVLGPAAKVAVRAAATAIGGGFPAIGS